MNGKLALAVMVVLALAAVVATATLYPSLPEQIPTHWGARGQIDAWGPKTSAAWYGPGFMLGWIALTWILPWLSPRRFGLEGFRSTYYLIMAGLVVMFGAVQAVILATALHPTWDTSRWLIGVLCVFLGFLGNVLGKVRRNFWIGVRTPWTLASEAVWDATHRLAARLLVASGLVAALLVLLGGPPIAAFVIVLSGLIVPAVWSLVYYKRFEGAGRL